MNQIAAIGHNNPPDPIDEITAAYDDSRAEAENWLDGSPVENEAQMRAVDDLRKAIREWRIALEAGQKSETAPLYDTYKAALARWKPTIEDAQRIEKGLVAAVDAFKRKLAAEKAAREAELRAEAEAKLKAAQEAHKAAAASDIEARRAAGEAEREAEQARIRAAVAAKDTVKGMRTVTRYEITDHRALLHWIARNDKDAVRDFIEEWARKEHKACANADGLRVWTEKIAF